MCACVCVCLSKLLQVCGCSVFVECERWVGTGIPLVSALPKTVCCNSSQVALDGQ